MIPGVNPDSREIVHLFIIIKESVMILLSCNELLNIHTSYADFF